MLQHGPCIQCDFHWGVQHLLTASSYLQDELSQAWAELYNLRAWRWLMCVHMPLCAGMISPGGAPARWMRSSTCAPIG